MGVDRTLDLPARPTVKELAAYLRVSPAEVIKATMKRGIMSTINQEIDGELAAELAADLRRDDDEDDGTQGSGVPRFPLCPLPADAAAAPLIYPDLTPDQSVDDLTTQHPL